MGVPVLAGVGVLLGAVRELLAFFSFDGGWVKCMGRGSSISQVGGKGGFYFFRVIFQLGHMLRDALVG